MTGYYKSSVVITHVREARFIKENLTVLFFDPGFKLYLLMKKKRKPRIGRILFCFNQMQISKQRFWSKLCSGIFSPCLILTLFSLLLYLCLHFCVPVSIVRDLVTFLYINDLWVCHAWMCHLVCMLLLPPPGGSLHFPSVCVLRVPATRQGPSTSTYQRRPLRLTVQMEWSQTPALDQRAPQRKRARVQTMTMKMMTTLTNEEEVGVGQIKDAETLMWSQLGSLLLKGQPGDKRRIPMFSPVEPRLGKCCCCERQAHLRKRVRKVDCLELHQDEQKLWSDAPEREEAYQEFPGIQSMAAQTSMHLCNPEAGLEAIWKVKGQFFFNNCLLV